MDETCIFCSELDRKNQNRDSEVWCKVKECYTPLISKKCEKFKSLISEVNNAE